MVTSLSNLQCFLSLITKPESAPEAIHLYSFPAAGENVPPSLRTVICQKKPVISARWNPVRRGSLALCCGGRSFYTWSDEWQAEDGTEEEVAECVGVPTSKAAFFSLFLVHVESYTHLRGF